MKLFGVNKVQRCPFKGTIPVTSCCISFFLCLFLFSLSFLLFYNNITIKHIKQKCMIKNKTCLLDKEKKQKKNRYNTKHSVPPTFEMMATPLKTNMLNKNKYLKHLVHFRIQQSCIAIRTTRPTVTSLPHLHGSYYRSKNQ